MKTFKFKHMMLILASLATLGVSSCKDYYNDDIDNEPTQQETKSYDLRGTIDFVDTYGSAHPTFTVAEVTQAGFEYGDLVNIEIGKNIHLKNIPYTTGINEVGLFDICFCDYNALGTNLSVAQLKANHQGYAAGDSMIITLSKKAGYLEMYKIMHSVYTTHRKDYKTDDQFANFREVKTTGIANGVLYRSSNPLNPVDNPVRYGYVDQLACAAGIQTEIDLADTEEKINQYIATDGFASTYCVDLFKNNQLVALGLDANFFSKNFMNKLKPGLQYMINHPAPYLLHCNEGKDRCGFISLLLESLAGASYQEVTEDYMTTLCNFYHVEPGTKSYQVRKELSVDRFIWLLDNYKSVNRFCDIDWDNIHPQSIDLQKAAHDYIIDCGLTEAECQTLIARLGGK